MEKISDSIMTFSQNQMFLIFLSLISRRSEFACTLHSDGKGWARYVGAVHLDEGRYMLDLRQIHDGRDTYNECLIHYVEAVSAIPDFEERDCGSMGYGKFSFQHNGWVHLFGNFADLYRDLIVGLAEEMDV